LVVSLFSRKDRPGSRKGARSAPRGSPEPASRGSRRESALRTEQAINRIESEMTGKTPGPAPRPGSRSAPALRPSAVPKPPPAPVPNPAAASVSVPAQAGEPRADAGAQQSGNGTKIASTFAGYDLADAIVIDVQGSELPAILEEAAVLYANGQSQPASRILRQCLDDPGLGPHHPLVWLMLFDLHQCTGDRTGFEALAAQYVERFDTAAPAWNAALSPTGDADAPETPAAASTSSIPGDGQEVIAPAPCPGELMLCGSIDGSIEASLRRLLDGEQEQAHLDVSTVTAVEASGAQALLDLLAGFEHGPRTLVVRGVRRLYGRLRACIEPGRPDPCEACWMLALQLLRVLDRHPEFEDLAIEYCITYEVSPPSWEPCATSIRQSDDDLTGAEPERAEADDPVTTAEPDPSDDPVADDEGFDLTATAVDRAFVLQGELAGRMQDEFEALRAYAAERGDIVIDCRRLRRIEFVAAGDLLNEIATMRSAGRQILFIEPNYLVYALMLVMGIHDLAEIRRRKI